MNILLVYLHSLVCIISFGMFIVRYKNNSQAFYLNYMFYILFYGLFYISLPSIISLVTGFSWVNASESTITDTSWIGLYFVTIFCIGYIVQKDKPIIHHNTIKINHIIPIVKIAAYLIAFYVSFVLILFSNEIVSVFGNRLFQSDINTMLENVYKLKAILIIQILFVIFLVLYTMKMKYLLFLIPFILDNVLLSGREYIFYSFVTYFLLCTILGKVIQIKYLFFVVFVIASISVLRSNGDFNLESLMQIFYEFIFTWSTTHLVCESTYTQDFVYTINYSFMRLFPSLLYSTLNGEYVSYLSEVNKDNPLGWGLAGSLVAEALSFKNSVITFLTPILIVLYAIFQNLILRSHSFTGYAMFIITVVYTQTMFRSSFYEIALYPFYIVIFFGTWIICVDALMNRKKHFYAV